MAEHSKIQWTDATWNVARGCTKVDKDCKYCYMYRQSMNGTRHDPMTVQRTKTAFTLPLRIKEPSKIFTSSLTDFFHEAIDSYRHEAWDIIRRCPQHTFQMLTKRPERIIYNLPSYWHDIRRHVWLGTSIGNQEGIHRLHSLLVPIQPGVKFLSLEPLYGPIDLRLDTQVDFGHRIGDLIDWVIVGGESGNDTGKYRYRPCQLEWIESIIDQCQAYNIPVFVKQLGTHLAKQMRLRDRNGGNIDEFPEHLKIREFPARKHEAAI